MFGGGLGVQVQGTAGGGGGGITIEQAAAAAPVQSVAGRGGDVVLTVGDVAGALSADDAALTYAPLEWPTFPWPIEAPSVGLLDTTGNYVGNVYARDNGEYVALSFGGIDMVTCEHLRVSLGGWRGTHAFEVLTNYQHINRLSVSGSDTGMAPTLSATGSDADVGMELHTKGEGDIILAPGGVTAVTITSNGTTFQKPVTFTQPIEASYVGLLDTLDRYIGNVYARYDGESIGLNFGGIDMVTCEHLRVSLGGWSGEHSFEVLTNYHHINRLSVSGSDTGMAPTLSATGSDADVGMELHTKGEGDIILAPGGATALTINSSGATFEVPVTIPSGSTVTGYAPLAALFTMLLGDGSDGDLMMPPSGTINLVRDMYYRNVAWPVGSSAAINPGGFRIFVSQRLYAENAPPGAIIRSGAAGGNGGAAGTAGAAGLSVGGTTIGGGLAGGAGAAGSPNNAVSGTAAASGTANGGNSAASGAGGQGGTGAGGAATAGPTATVADIRQPKLDLIRMVSAINGGLGGPGGGGGAGDGSSGGGGAGGASGAGVIAIYARQISRGSAQSWIQANGAQGGTGGAPTAGNRGGGGGASGSGGGWVYIVCDELLGEANPAAIQCNGGPGGPGGNGIGTGRGGNGGGSGAGGRATVIELSTNTTTVTFGAAGVAGTATSTVTGGAGAPATLFSAAL